MKDVACGVMLETTGDEKRILMGMRHEQDNVWEFPGGKRENGETLEEVYEPFLIQQGFIVRTPRGREVTERAYKHLGRIKNNQEGLF